MSIFAYFKAKKWFERFALVGLKRYREIQTVSKNKKISFLTILIFISGCFFYNHFSSIFPSCFANDYKPEGYLEHEKAWVAKISYVESMVKIQKQENSKTFLVDTKKYPEVEKRVDFQNIELEIGRIVGNAPIREMIPSIIKFDQRVAAFVVGIAKKESDWGRRSPSLSGKTCYNYWGYKGKGSRGASMGYACFGSPEEAVEVVGKRIENLVAKNINEPRKMLVWKCGSSCAGHDPGGVQKWVSDVNMYFSRVMQIKNS